MIEQKFFDVSCYEKRNLHCLDSVRGIMAVVILGCHFFAMCGYSMPHFGLFTPLSILTNARLGLCYFFFLSGFVICYSQQKKRQRVNVIRYGLKRYVRLLQPIVISIFAMWLLMLTDCLSIGALLPQSSWLQSLPYANYTHADMANPIIDSLFSTYFLGHSYFNCNLWAIRYEFILPLLIVPISGYLGYKLVRYLCCTLTVLGLFFFVGSSHFYAFAMMLGMLSCYYIRDIDFQRNKTTILIICTTIILSNWLLTSFLNKSYYLSYFANLASAISISLLVLKWDSVSDVLDKRVFSVIGAVSYEIYVYHLCVILTLGVYLYQRIVALGGGSIAAWLSYLVTLITTIVISISLSKVSKVKLMKIKK